MLEQPQKDDLTTKVKEGLSHEANQQVTDREIGYLAAMIEGEGTIALNLRKKSWNGWNGWGADVRIVVANTDSGIIQKCANILENMGIRPFIHTYDRKGMGKNGQWKDCVQIGVSKISEAYKLLILVIPELAGDKKHKAELIVTFLERRMARKGQRSAKGGQSWYDEQDWENLKEVYKYSDKSLPDGFLRDYTRSSENVADDIVQAS